MARWSITGQRKRSIAGAIALAQTAADHAARH
jgi:hypothetical protein